MRKKKLTERQAEVLDFIRDYFQREKVMPTYAEVAEWAGVTVSSVFMTIQKIAEKGHIKQDRRPRMMKLL